MAQSKNPASQDAIALLKADHTQVDKLFKQYDKLAGEGSPEEKSALAQQICTELAAHTQIEEEIFYPAAREAMDEHDLLDEAEVEHASAKELIAQISSMQADEPLYDAKVKVLGEYVRHHVKEEQDELFPKMKKTDVDLDALGRQLAQRKQQLLAEYGEMLEGDAGMAARQKRMAAGDRPAASQQRH